MRLLIRVMWPDQQGRLCSLLGAEQAWFSRHQNWAGGAGGFSSGGQEEEEEERSQTGGNSPPARGATSHSFLPTLCGPAHRLPAASLPREIAQKSSRRRYSEIVQPCREHQLRWWAADDKGSFVKLMTVESGGGAPVVALRAPWWRRGAT